MKVFFAGSSNVSSDALQTYRHILGCLETNGHQIQDSWIVNRLRNNAHKDTESPDQVLHKQTKLLREADFMVVECSTPSFGIGFLLHQALLEHKPTLCLYKTGSQVEVSDMIAGSKSPLLSYVHYETNQDIEQRTADFLREDFDDELQKFNFISTRKITEFIEEQAKLQGVSKSEYLRQAINERIMAE